MKKLTVEEKFAKAVLKLRNLRPFYSSLYEAIEKVEVEYIDTIGVTCDKIIYNKKYIDKLEFEEFMFDTLHELSHIALMHVVRRENRDPFLWNIACDLYVNKMISEEFRVVPGIYRDSDIIKITPTIVFDQYMDINEEIVEDIYNRIEKQANEQGYFSCTENKTYVFDTSKHPDRYHNYIRINRQSCSDLVDNGEDKNRQEDKNRKVIIDAKTRAEMSGGSSNNNIGCGTGKLEELIDKLLESKVDWKKLLRKYCIQYKSKDISFSSPDKRMFYQDVIYPGEHSESEEVLKNVKLCIDTSGSISKEDLGYFIGQVGQLLKTFKTSAELINWDTEIESIRNIQDNQILGEEARKVKGRGGTDASCLFEYFDSKQCKIKPFVVVVFTDGYIPIIKNSKWQKRYKNTIWIMTKDHNNEFNPPFGKKAYANFR